MIDTRKTKKKKTKFLTHLLFYWFKIGFDYCLPTQLHLAHWQIMEFKCILSYSMLNWVSSPHSAFIFEMTIFLSNLVTFHLTLSKITLNESTPVITDIHINLKKIPKIFSCRLLKLYWTNIDERHIVIISVILA